MQQFRVAMLVLTVAVLVVGVGSCKKDSEREGAFDPQVDGIAVEPVAQIDLELAQRINKEGAIGPTTDIIVEAPPAAEGSYYGAGGSGDAEAGSDEGAREAEPVVEEPYYEPAYDANEF